MNRATAIGGLALLVAGFSAGWYVNGLRMDNTNKEQQVTTLTRDLKSANDQAATIDKKLGEVVTKTQAAADTMQGTLDTLATIRTESTKAQEKVTQQTQRIDNEIAKLGVPKCQLDFNTGSLWRAAGEKANSWRSAVYGPDSEAKH